MKGFRTKQRWRKSSIKTEFQQKIKLFADFRKAVDSGNKSVGGRVVFIFYSLCQSLWVSSATINSIPKSTDSQDASSEARGYRVSG